MDVHAHPTFSWRPFWDYLQIGDHIGVRRGSVRHESSRIPAFISKQPSAKQLKLPTIFLSPCSTPSGQATLPIPGARSRGLVWLIQPADNEFQLTLTRLQKAYTFYYQVWIFSWTIYDYVIMLGHPYKLLKPFSHCSARRSFCSIIVVGLNVRNDLPAGIVDFRSLQSFKTRNHQKMR